MKLQNIELRVKVICTAYDFDGIEHILTREKEGFAIFRCISDPLDRSYELFYYRDGIHTYDKSRALETLLSLCEEQPTLQSN